METQYTYLDAFNELQQIVEDVESGDINVDDLAQKISRAADLIQICKAKLTASEDEVNNMLKKLQNSDLEKSDETTTEEE